jgi:putative addiction module component (TIGR02574 family)
MSTREFLDEFRHLSLDEKLELLHALWDDVEKEAATRPLSDDERRALDDRLKDIEADPRPDISWDDLRRELSDRR